MTPPRTRTAIAAHLMSGRDIQHGTIDSAQVRDGIIVSRDIERCRRAAHGGQRTDPLRGRPHAERRPPQQRPPGRLLARLDPPAHNLTHVVVGAQPQSLPWVAECGYFSSAADPAFPATVTIETVSIDPTATIDSS